ncbi:hypothetical protein NIES4102_34280 [Chondrocystis sp. NIES-4102]|nr:hypothetical protein NIES4102_34280 [Chondrocystis sp. NIES-4102]
MSVSTMLVAIKANLFLFLTEVYIVLGEDRELCKLSIY